MGRKKIGCERVALRITKEQRETIQKYVDSGYAKDLSDFVRKAIDMAANWLEAAI